MFISLTLSVVLHHSCNLPVVAGRFDGIARVDRICTHCGGITVADEIHECSVLQPLRQQYAALLTSNTDTVRSFFAQQDHMQVCLNLHCVDYLKV